MIAMEGRGRNNEDDVRQLVDKGEPVDLQFTDVSGEVASPVTGVLHLKVNGCEGRYDGDCCKDDPFCDKHCDLDEDVFYVMKIKKSKIVTAELTGDGVVFHDAWSIGRLVGFENILFRTLLCERVKESQHRERSSECERSSLFRVTDLPRSAP